MISPDDRPTCERHRNRGVVRYLWRRIHVLSDYDASVRLGLRAVDQVVDVAGDTRRLVAVLTGRLRDREHLLGEADEWHRNLHLARHIEPEVHVLWHPRLARLIIATHHDFHDAPGRHRILLRILKNVLE